MICVLVGILLDLDHLIDYVRDNGLNLNVRYFFQYVNEGKYEQLYVLFHAYEYLLPLYLLIIISNYNPLVAAAAIGFTQHLLFDQITNPVKPLAYFLTYRLKHSFSKQSLLKEEYLASFEDN